VEEGRGGKLAHSNGRCTPNKLRRITLALMLKQLENSINEPIDNFHTNNQRNTQSPSRFSSGLKKRINDINFWLFSHSSFGLYPKKGRATH
jgi:hypothetical protein